jgi:hypothetical protein
MFNVQVGNEFLRFQFMHDTAPPCHVTLETGALVFHGPRPRTECYVYQLLDGDVKKMERAVGQVVCHPNDHYDIRKGRKAAMAAALKKLGLSKADRLAVWQAFFAASPKHKASRPPMVAIGTVLKGFCAGYFGSDSLGLKRIEALGADWVVVRCMDGDRQGEPNFACARQGDDWQALLEEWSKKGQHWTFNTVTGKPELVEDE